MTTPVRSGGRFPSGRVMPPAQPGTHAYPVRPTVATPPAGSTGAVPRTGGRTQQGARIRPRAGGRTQQGTQGGQAVKPGPAAKPTPKPGGKPAAGPAGPGPARAGGATAAGLIVALFAYPMGLALITGGPRRMQQWIAAKFWNATTATTAATASTATLTARTRRRPARRKAAVRGMAA